MKYLYVPHTDEHWKHFAKCKKPVTEDHILYDSIHIKCPELKSMKIDSILIVA